MDFHGKAQGSIQAEVSIKPGEARRCLNTMALGEISLRSQFLHAAFAGHEATQLLTAERYLHLPQAHITARVVEDRVEVATDAFARQVTLEFDGVTGAVFADNFFDLVPGRKRAIAVPKAAGGRTLTIRALNADPVRLAWKP
jgi:hypothetical protein